MPTWSDDNLKNPHAEPDKQQRVREMFTAIAPSYDLNNRLHSMWQDQRWRRKTVKLAALRAGDVVADIACGTGDLAIAFARATPKPLQVIGIDYTFAMLPRAQTKSQSVEAPIAWLQGDAQNLPMDDESCDVLSIAFGIRNVQSIEKALEEFARVLRPGGRLLILEFSEPENPLIRSMNRLYCHQIMPRTATMISGDKSGAYKYLPRSIQTFVPRSKMIQMMSDAGFANVKAHPMTFGVCVCYVGVLSG